MKITHTKSRQQKIIFVEMTKREALETIKSMVAQLAAEDPNVGRYEGYTKDGTYFSIAVVDRHEEG